MARPARGILGVMPSCLLAPACAALIAAASAAAAPTPAAAPGASADSLRSFVTKNYEVYAPTPADLFRISKDVEYAWGQVRRFFGEPAPLTAIVVFDSRARLEAYDFSRFRERGVPCLAWVLPPRGAAPRALADDATALAHEAGHLMFRAGVQKWRGQPPLDDAAHLPAYRHDGHPDAPDWLDEAFAALCEPPSRQAQREDAIRAKLAARIPLPTLFAMKYPVPLERRGPLAPPAAPDPGAPRIRGLAPADLERQFVNESLALARYFNAVEHDRYIGTVAREVMTGKTLGEALMSATVLYSKPEALEAQWVEWMKQPK
jgi:hypothetical protein